MDGSVPFTSTLIVLFLHFICNTSISYFHELTSIQIDGHAVTVMRVQSAIGVCWRWFETASGFLPLLVYKFFSWFMTETWTHFDFCPIENVYLFRYVARTADFTGESATTCPSFSFFFFFFCKCIFSLQNRKPFMCYSARAKWIEHFIDNFPMRNWEF